MPSTIPIAVRVPPPATVPAPLAPQRWWRVMPLVFITYSLACLDRANYGFAAAGGMAEDLGITAGMNSLIGSFFLTGYFLFQIPGAIYAQKYSVKKLIFGCMVVWGVCATVTGMLHDVWALLVVRCLLGVAEAAVLPAMLIFVSRWFTRSERSRANTMFIIGNPTTMLWMSVVSGYLIARFDWRSMFILEGFPTVVWALCWWMLARERPRDAQWMSREESRELETRLEAEQAGMPPTNYRTAFRSRLVILFSAQYFLWSLGFFGFILWLPSILRQGSTIGMVMTGWLAAVPYLVAVISMVAVSFLSDRLRDRRIVVLPCLSLASLAFAALYFTSSDNFWLSFALLVVAGAAMQAPYGPFWALVPEKLPQNVAGGAMAMINSMGALGSFFGGSAVGWLNGATGNAQLSYVLMSLSLAGAVMMFTLAVPRKSVAR